MRVSKDLLDGIAHAVRPHITPFIEAYGSVPDKDLKALIKQHTGHQIVSERSLQIINEELCEC